jgi:hypothetical protein
MRESRLTDPLPIDMLDFLLSTAVDPVKSRMLSSNPVIANVCRKLSAVIMTPINVRYENNKVMSEKT